MSIKTHDMNTNPRLTMYLVETGEFHESLLNVVDVGARGGFEDHWDFYEEQVNLIGFELDVEECKRLSDNASGDSNRHYFSIAPDSKKGSRSFYIQPHTASSSFYKTNQGFVRRFPGWEELIPESTRHVAVADLDSILRESNLDSIDLLKLDTEGSEADIFEGARQTLQSAVGIDVEVVFTPWRIDMPTFADVDIILRSYGFIPFNIVPFYWEKICISPLRYTRGVLGPTDKGQLIWGQVIYFKDAVAQITGTPSRISEWSRIRILKLASLMELYGQLGSAIELINIAYMIKRIEGSERDIFRDSLTPTLNGEIVSYQQYVDAIGRQGPPRYRAGKQISGFKPD
jgi:FkbM family methyltransferase